MLSTPNGTRGGFGDGANVLARVASHTGDLPCFRGPTGYTVRSPVTYSCDAVRLKNRIGRRINTHPRCLRKRGHGVQVGLLCYNLYRYLNSDEKRIQTLVAYSPLYPRLFPHGIGGSHTSHIAVCKNLCSLNTYKINYD